MQFYLPVSQLRSEIKRCVRLVGSGHTLIVTTLKNHRPVAVLVGVERATEVGLLPPTEPEK